MIMKRQQGEKSEDDDNTIEDTRKLQYIQFDTFKKWKHNLDKEFKHSHVVRV